MNDGTELTEKVLVNRGGPGNPLSEAELGTKFELNAVETMDVTQAHTLHNAITELATGATTPRQVGAMLQRRNP
jgi:hypothetical protein